MAEQVARRNNASSQRCKTIAEPTSIRSQCMHQFWMASIEWNGSENDFIIPAAVCCHHNWAQIMQNHQICKPKHEAFSIRSLVLFSDERRSFYVNWLLCMDECQRWLFPFASIANELAKFTSYISGLCICMICIMARRIRHCTCQNVYDLIVNRILWCMRAVSIDPTKVNLGMCEINISLHRSIEQEIYSYSHAAFHIELSDEILCYVRAITM